MGRIARLVDRWLSPGAVDRELTAAPVSAIVSASLFDAPYLAAMLPHMLGQARFPFAERVVVIDPRVPQRPRGRPYGTRADLERIASEAKAAGVIDRVVELDVSEGARRDVLRRYYPAIDTVGFDTTRSVYAALAALDAARNDVVAWFAADVMFHARRDSWVRDGLQALTDQRDLWLTTTHSGPREPTSQPVHRVQTAPMRHFLCDRRRFHGALRDVGEGRGQLGRSISDALQRHRAYAGVLDSTWHLQPVSHDPPLTEWIDKLVAAVERGIVPPDQRDGCLRLHQPTSRGDWRRLLFGAETGARAPEPRHATLVERRPVPGPAPISVIVPIRNRAGADVRNALASLAWQTSGRPWEVIVVSHGSDASVDAELATITRDAGATLITVGAPAEPWCKPLALNTGILASDPAIAFVMTMDADMILADTMLDTVLAELRGDPDRIVLCQSSDLPEDCVVPSDPAVLRAQFGQLAQQATVRGAYGTGGIQAMRRTFLVDVHGYDEDMLWWGALDTDLVRRAEAAGLRTTWITQRTAMLHQWHPRKHRILDEATRSDAQGAWLRNHEIMTERAKDIVRNRDGWGATLISDGATGGG